MHSVMVLQRLQAVCPSFRDTGTEVMTNFETLYTIFCASKQPGKHLMHAGVMEHCWAVLAASLNWQLLSSGDPGIHIGKKMAQVLCSGTVKAMCLNLIRYRDLKTDWLNHEFNDSEYQGDG